jgi:hypothetical protein
MVETANSTTEHNYHDCLVSNNQIFENSYKNIEAISDIKAKTIAFLHTLVILCK